MACGLARPKGRSLALCAVVAVVGLWLCAVHPEWLPRCLFRWLSGYDCPACGAQRACMHLLHGEFRTALLCNPYLFVVAPYLLLLLISEWCCAPDARLRSLLTRRTVIVFFALLMFAWWIFRNTPCWHRIIG